MSKPARIAEDASVDSSAEISHDSIVWNLTQVRDHVAIGAECIIGRNVYIGSGVKIGNRVKIQNNSLIYEPAVVEDGVFIGPATVFTNDAYPRAITPDGELKSASDWEAVGVTVRTGAAIGARSVCVAPVAIGEWALVAAGSVVTQDVPDFALVAGTPARFKGWVGKTGRRLNDLGGSRYQCPDTGQTFVQVEGQLRAEGIEK